MKIFRNRIQTLVVAIGIAAALLALFLQLGPLSQEARRLRLQHGIREAQDAINQNQKIFENNKRKIEELQKMLEKTKLDLQKNTHSIEENKKFLNDIINKPGFKQNESDEIRSPPASP